MVVVTGVQVVAIRMLPISYILKRHSVEDDDDDDDDDGDDDEASNPRI